MAILEGRAKGGPRDGVKLQCPHSWDGRIVKSQPGPTYHDGHYVFDVDELTWVWREADSVTEQIACGARSRRAFAGYKYR